MEKTEAIRAGEAFAEAAESDPKFKAVLERATREFKVMWEILRETMNSAEYRELQEAKQRNLEALADAIRKARAAAGNELATQHFPRPESVEDWEHLARIVELPHEILRRGKWTPREVFACALAWADRQKIKTKLRTDAKPADPEPDALADAKPSTEPVGNTGVRRGRLPTDESKAKRAHLLATIREHPSLISDPAKLASMIGVGESTIRRWIGAEQRKYRASRAANPPDDKK